MIESLYTKLVEGLDDVFVSHKDPGPTLAKQKEKVLKVLKDAHATQNSDGTWSCAGSINISNLGLFEIPVQFKEVWTDFNCADNQLTSLKGCPEKVGYSFFCDTNQLTSLEGGPKQVGNNYSCSDNQLTTLEGAPKEVPDDFNCEYNNLKNLKGAPEKIGGDFWCVDNPLETVKGLGDVDGRFFADRFIKVGLSYKIE